MSGPTCDLCSRPVDGTAYVCSPCASACRDALLRLAELAPEVEVSILKLARYGNAGGSAERPVPFDDVRADRAAAVGNTLATWARHVAESRGVPLPHPVVGSGAEAAARWLADQVEWLRHQREAAEAFGDLEGAAREVERIVDRPRDRWYAGACWAELGEVDEAGEPLRCTEDLYATRDARVVRCRECGAEHDAQHRREWLLQEAQDTLAHAELVARALTALGVEDVTPARVRGMARHGRLAAKGMSRAGDPTYRIGDVLDVIEEQERIEAERRRRREERATRCEERREAHAGDAA